MSVHTEESRNNYIAELEQTVSEYKNQLDYAINVNTDNILRFLKEIEELKEEISTLKNILKLYGYTEA